MANGAYVQARIDPHIKEEARSVLDELGISMSEAIVVYLKQIILQRGIPFELKLPNKATSQAVQELESGKGVTFSSADELLEDLEN
jgi:DNA-damage-inducible protein J